MRFILVLLLLSFSAFGQITEFCGKIESVGRYEFVLGPVEYISVRVNGYEHKHILLYHGGDITNTISKLFELEKNIPEHLPQNNILLSNKVTYMKPTLIDNLLGREIDPFKFGLKYTYKIENKYSACAKVDTSKIKNKFTEVLSYELFLDSELEEKLIYSRY